MGKKLDNMKISRIKSFRIDARLRRERVILFKELSEQMKTPTKSHWMEAL